MRINRRSVVAGLTVGVLAGGAGGALAAGTTTTTTMSPRAASGYGWWGEGWNGSDWNGADPRGTGRAGGGWSGPAWGGVGGDGIDAAANYLGLTASQLRTRLADGQTLAHLAAAQGRSVSGLENAIVASVRARIHQIVTTRWPAGAGFASWPGY